MAQEVINVGAAPNDGQGDPIRTSFIKCNNNFGELYSRAQTSPPPTLVGTVGDQAGMYAYDENFFYYCFANYDGSSTIWAQITNVGNITAENLVNGTSSVAIPVASGNISISVGGTANVGVWSTQGLDLKGNLLPFANSTYDLGSSTRQWRSLYVSNSSVYINNVPLTVSGNTLQVAGANVATYTAGNDITVGNVSAANISGTNITVTNAIISNSVNVTNDLTVSDDLIVNADITSGGTVTAAFFAGDGSQLTNLPGGGGNGTGNSQQIINGFSKVAIPTTSGNIQFDAGLSAGIMTVAPLGLIINGELDVAANVNFGSNVNAITATGNITAPYFIGDGSQLTNVGGGGNYGNADVALFLQSYNGNITANNISLTNTANANILYASAVSATAVSAPTMIGDLTGDVTGDLVGNTTGIHNGLVGSINILELSWDFGTITGVITNPMTWLINNIGGGFDAGTVLAPNATDIDIGVLTN